jgi:hypothetical protein
LKCQPAFAKRVEVHDDAFLVFGVLRRALMATSGAVETTVNNAAAWPKKYFVLLVQLLRALTWRNRAQFRAM